MGGLLHLFDFNQTSRKSVSSRKHDGLEAPRNSLELPIESEESYDAVGENIPYSYQVMQNSSKSDYHYLGEAPMKKLIDDEICKKSGRNVPSVVARLMGMETLPSETRPTINVKTKKDEITVNKFLNKEQSQNSSIGRSPLGLKHSKQTEGDLPSQTRQRYSNKPRNTSKFEKPRPREHPQEEQLQKFKKEFEAWQAARPWEHSGVVEVGSIPRQWHAREDLNKEKMPFNEDLEEGNSYAHPIKLEVHTLHPVLKTGSQRKSGLWHQGYLNEPIQGIQKETMTLRNRITNNDVQHVPTAILDDQSKSSAPTRIVILKPGPDTSISRGDSHASSSEIVEEEGSIEDLLEEVRERLRLEMHGKSVKRDVVVRGGGIETPFSEKPSKPRQIARHIANQVRESVTRDFGMNLSRSKSTRTYRSEIQVNGPGSPEFIDRDTRILMSQRLRNVLKEEPPSTIESRLRPVEGLKAQRYWDNVQDEMEFLSSSFRHGQPNDVLHMGDMSPRNLVRSMSAPVSASSFGKLLLEDRHVLTGAHIRRRQEASENVSAEVRKTRKEKFGFKGKVSNLRYKFTFKGKLFGRKIQSLEEPWSTESDSMNDIRIGPNVGTNPGSTHENSTEVPPSPASVCSSIHEEFYRIAEHPSPISTLDVPMIEEHNVPKVFRDISSNLHELRRKLNQLEFGSSEDMEKPELPHEIETDAVEGPAEAYIKNLLIVSGLYDGSSNPSVPNWGPSAKPLSNWVFEKVEATYAEGAEVTGAKNEQSEIVIDRKILFDLSNEALSIILAPSSAMPTFKRKIMHPTMIPPRRKALLDTVWKMIHTYVYPPSDSSIYSLDSMVARDLGMNPWSGMTQIDVDLIGKDIENMILGKLIEETVREIWL